MNANSLMNSLDWAMESLPFPMLLLYVIAVGLLWLFAEAMLTRTARAMPGWRRPFPVLPVVSEVVAWTVRGSSWLLWTWALLYVALAAAHWSSTQLTPAWSGVTAALLDIAAAWRQTYVVVVGLLPPVVVQMLPGV